MTRTRILASISLAAVLALLPAALTFADGPVTDDTIFRVSITDFLTLTVDQTDNIAHLSPSTRFNTGSIVASVATNNAAGYTLTFEDADDRNGLERSGYSSASVEDKPLYNIPSVVSATTYANLTDDTYGYFLGSTTATEATYLPVPLTSTEIDSSDEPTAPAVSTTINFGVKIAATRPSGTYEDTIVISAVAAPLPQDACNPNATTISGAVCMQDMNSDVISSMVTETQYQLRDNRDDKMYWVSKLADGKVWMTQNLDLDLETTPTNVAPLTSENTDLNKYGSRKYDTDNGYSLNNGIITWTPERSTIPVSSIGNISGWSYSDDDPYSIDTGEWYWNNTWYSSDNCYDSQRNNVCDYLTGNATDKFSQSPTSFGNGSHGHIGNHYNWSAAIASNDSSGYSQRSYNDANSICPAGWRLPTIYNTDTDTKNEYRFLLNKYNGEILNGSERDRISVASPLYFVRGGYISGTGDGNREHPGEEGYYWSSTALTFMLTYSLKFDSNDVDPMFSFDRAYGYSVRCVAR